VLPVGPALQLVRCPEFLRISLALAKFMRLSSMKATHAAVSSAAYRKSGIGREWYVLLLWEAFKKESDGVYNAISCEAGIERERCAERVRSAFL
jgi:hypothetical protein